MKVVLIKISRGGMAVSLVRHGENRDWLASVGLQGSGSSTVSIVGMRVQYGYMAIGESGHQQGVLTRGLPQLAPCSTSSLSECRICLSHPS